MNHGSLFSGIGGFDLAAEWMGWNNIFHCEWNDFGQKVLKHHFPKAISHADITKTDFTVYRNRIDIITGGFPCQPYSSAGKRLGTADDRHLFPEMLRAIREIQPTWVVGENVLGIVNWNEGLVFHEVQVDLEAEGYEVQSYVLPAASVNAPHRRNRVWFVAHTNGSCKTNGQGKDRSKTKDVWGKEKGNVLGTLCSNGSSSRTNNRCSTKNTIQAGWKKCDGTLHNNGSSSYTNGNRQSCKEHRQKESGWSSEKGIPSDWKNFPIESPVCDGNDGFPFQLDNITFPKWRNETIKAAGNAIVPRVALQIFKAIEKYNQQYGNSI